MAAGERRLEVFVAGVLGISDAGALKVSEIDALELFDRKVPEV